MAKKPIDESRLGEYMGLMIGYMTGGALSFGMWIGDELGLYKGLADGGAQSADALAERCGCNPRLVREWLNGQAAGHIIDYDAAANTFELSAEAEAALADESSPVFVAHGTNTFASLFLDHEKILGAFRGDGGLAWGDHDHRLFMGTEWFFRTGYRAHLPNEWIPSLDGVEDKLRAGATIADVGCGHGASAVVLATAFPRSRIFGFDSHPASIDTARKRAADAGVADRTSFEVADAKSYAGEFDLICFFDCLHDMGDPAGAVRHAKDRLKPDGTVLLVEPFALDDTVGNLSGNPMAPLFYTASAAICTPNSLSQEVGLGLGAQAGEAALRALFDDAGFTVFRRATETTMNMILEARL